MRCRGASWRIGFGLFLLVVATRFILSLIGVRASARVRLLVGRGDHEIAAR